MAMTNLEMISMAPKSQEASVVRQSEQQRPLHEQVALSERLAQEADRQGQQTIRSNKTDTPEYRYDARDEGRNSDYQGNGGRKRREDKKQDGHPVNHSSTGIDIRI